MKDRISVESYKQKKMLIARLTGLIDLDSLNLLDEIYNVLVAENINYLILDVANTTVTKTILDKTKEQFKKHKEQNFKVRVAVVGLNKSQQLIVKTIKQNQYFTSSIDDAKEWFSQMVD